MLSIEHQQVIKGLTVYRDFHNLSQYYFLPKEKVSIANNGKGIQFVAYIDGEVLEGTDPEFSKDLDREGGFLTLEVELGPDENEIEQVRSELASAGTGEVRLAQVPFKDGAVKLVMFGSEGGDDNPAVKFTVAGSTKPALLGKQTAVFSLQLGGKEAQIMWNLLKKGSQTQVGIVYDLEYLGVLPAYHLEITVDFKATEDFWQHHIDADFSLDTGSLKIVSNNDIDLIMRNLVNTGAITVKQVDYTGGGTGGPLGADDPNAMKLVRELLSPSLFEATAIPREDYNVLASTLPNTGGTTTSTATSSTPTRTSTTSTPTSSTPTTPTSPTPTTPTSPTAPTTGGPSTGGGGTTPTTTETNTNLGGGGPSPSTLVPPSNDGVTPVPTPTPEPPPRITPTTSTTPSSTTPTTTVTTPTPTPTTPTPTPSRPTTPTTTSPTPTSPTTSTTPPPVDKVQTKININAGYSLKHRSISQETKRTFVFDKAEAKSNMYHPSSALTLEGTQFDADKQVMLVRLGDGPFKEITIEIRAALDFDEFQISEAIVHIAYGFSGAQGDKTKRKYNESIAVSNNIPRKAIRFFVDEFGTLVYDYYVEFIHKAGSIIGTHETKIKSRLFENVTEKDIAVNISDHSPLIPVEIQPGNIIFSNDGIQSVQVFVSPAKESNGRTTIFRQNASDLQKFLIAPAVPNKYQYFKRQQFFFKDDSVEEEFDAQKDSQVIVNSPRTGVLTISPIVRDKMQIIAKAIVQISFTNIEGEELSKSLVLTPLNDNALQPTFAVVLKEDEPRIWRATTQFLLTNGEIVTGVEQTYNTDTPAINLENSGLKVLKIFTLLGASTFEGTIAAIEVQIFENDAQNGEAPLETVLLRKTKTEDVVVLKGVGVADPLSVVAHIFRTTGAEEVLNIVVPSGLDELMLRIANI